MISEKDEWKWKKFQNLESENEIGIQTRFKSQNFPPNIAKEPYVWKLSHLLLENPISTKAKATVL
jgi:hypothetical protein